MNNTQRPIPTREQNPNGLHQRYIVAKTRGKLDEKAEYFVLRLDNNGNDPNHIKACRRAIAVYAHEISEHIPQLAKDLQQRYPADKEFLEANPLEQCKVLYDEMKAYKSMLDNMQNTPNYEMLFTLGERTSIQHIKYELEIKMQFITELFKIF